MITIFYFPEFFLTIGNLLLIIIAVFLKKNVFKKITALSIIILFIVLFLLLKDNSMSFALYNNFFQSSQFIIFFKFLVILGSIATLVISINFFNELNLNQFEIPILILFSTLGMMILISSNNLISMYLGIELQSLALYVMTAIDRDSLKSSEAGVKYFVLGALSSGILLYGCSLIYGFTGSTNFDEIKLAIFDLEKLNLGILFGLIFVLTGLAFKISAVPFHMWTPDVYEGAPTAITAFFAIVPKLAAIALIYRLCLEPFGMFIEAWRQIIIFLSIASMLIGAIGAIAQKNLKRLLAYSSIGHVGYVLIGLVAANSEGIKGLIIYMTIYLFMNVSIFSVILSIKTENRYIELLSDLSGISKKKPVISLCIGIVMLSMAGIPPFAGFFGKFYIFVSALKADFVFLAVIGVIASVISAYYYLRIIKIMYFDESKLNYQSHLNINTSLILFLSTLIISLFILYPSLLVDISTHISLSFF